MRDLLGGLRVLDLTTIVLGPMATQMLGDLGADVVKIETPAGDLARAAGARSPHGMGAVFANNNRNKRSLALDLKRPAAKAALERLVETADVFVHNIRPRSIERLGFGPEALLARNPRLVYVAAVGFGSHGPYAGRPAYDDVIQAASGLASLPVETGQPPAYVPSILADKVAALYTVQAVLAGVLRRERTGAGMAIEVPMFESLVAFLMSEHLDAASFAEGGGPGYGRLLNPNRRPFRTADGWLAVMPYDRGHWTRILGELGRTDVVDAPWFASDAERNARSGELYGILADGLAARSSAAWTERLAALGIPHAPLASLTDLLSDPHLAAVDFFRPTDGLPGRVRSVAQPVAFSSAPPAPDRPAPRLGEHGREVLAEAGLDETQIAAALADTPT